MRDGKIGPAGRAEHGPTTFGDIAFDVLAAHKAGKFNLIVHASEALAGQYDELLGKLKC